MVVARRSEAEHDGAVVGPEESDAVCAAAQDLARLHDERCRSSRPLSFTLLLTLSLVLVLVLVLILV